ncbi:hypothetical protein DFR68_10342 [Nocardia mexicana]|uniref:Secreted protein n=1 Tax=Nocardia mexicana TaxID=279262 RepID=A0A370H7N4_9NOCA|nr:hypothetical protein DFR68_10342 [Nocardia mexicana]
MRKRLFTVALMTGGIILGSPGLSSAALEGPFEGEHACFKIQQSTPDSTACFERPQGSGQWYFDGPLRNNPYL